MFSFGSGFLYGVPTAGALAPNPTPIQFGTLQDVSLDISGDIKELWGQNRFSDVRAMGKQKITGKAKFGRISGLLLNQLFFGTTPTVGYVHNIHDEAASIPATTPYTCTVANSATFGEDLGVKYSATGKSFQKVGSSPTVGEYSVSAGVYTFAAADEGVAVLISYSYNPASQTSGITVPVVNTPMGNAPQCEVHLYDNFGSPDQFGIRLYSAIFSKLSMATKNEDFMVPELDFSAGANAGGQVFDLLISE